VEDLRRNGGLAGFLLGEENVELLDRDRAAEPAEAGGEHELQL
jgi:hypothetical protein